VTNANTIDLQDGDSSRDFDATAKWDETFNFEPSGVWNIPRAAKIACLAGYLFVVSPVTAVSDVWASEARTHEAAITAPALLAPMGRPITRAEALRIARRILLDAERGRIEAAKEEAARWAEWSDSE
jgi:hypothetical protein